MAPILDIIFEDNHLIAINKPPGMLTQSDKTKDKSLFTLTKDYLKQKYNKPGNVYLGLLHRLDRPTSGIILFAKTSKAASRLSQQFRQNHIEKKYLALVEGQIKVGESRELTHYLKKDPITNKTQVSDKYKTGYKKSILRYKTINPNISHLSFFICHFKKQTHQKYPPRSKFSLLEVDLKTGRSHQIRAQLSHIGHPIVGDIKYGALAPLPDKNICLASYQLTFTHPTKRKMIKLELSSL